MKIVERLSVSLFATQQVATSNSLIPKVFEMTMQTIEYLAHGERSIWRDAKCVLQNLLHVQGDARAELYELFLPGHSLKIYHNSEVVPSPTPLAKNLKS